jgi:hypothetical protein
MRAIRGLCLLAALVVAAPALAAKPPPMSTVPCSAPAYRQFDFWAGSWVVTNPAGKQVGTNHIVKILGDCALQEHWVGSGRSRGTSLNVYDARRHVWHQTWVDNSGGLLVIEGGMKDGSMVMSGTSISRTGKTVLNRITWTPRDKDHVRQLWQVSTDGGKHWKTVFDGLYTRAAKKD